MGRLFLKFVGLFTFLLFITGCGKNENDPQAGIDPNPLNLSEYLNGKTLTVSKRIPGTYITGTYLMRGEIAYSSNGSENYCYIYSYYNLEVGSSFRVEPKRTTSNTWASLRLVPTSGGGSTLELTCYSRAPVKMFSYGDFRSVVGGYLSVQ